MPDSIKTVHGFCSRCLRLIPKSAQEHRKLAGSIKLVDAFTLDGCFSYAHNLTNANGKYRLASASMYQIQIPMSENSRKEIEPDWPQVHMMGHISVERHVTVHTKYIRTYGLEHIHQA